MTPTRRDFLSAITGGSIIFSGCTAPLDPGRSSERKAGTETPTLVSGGHPPWKQLSSESDIILDDERYSERTIEPITVTVEAGEFNETVELEPQARWISENVIPAGTTTTVSVTTATGLESRTEWPGESNNELVLKHYIRESEIGVRGFYKYGHDQGGENWVNENRRESPTAPE